MDSLSPETDAPATPSADVIGRAEAAAAVARAHADAADRDARFPKEAFEELRRQRLLSMAIPEALGGDGAPIADIADVCALLAASCSASGMIFAMHQAMVACLVRHHGGHPWLLQFLRDAAARQFLLAASTTEGLGGGDVRSSQAPLVCERGRVRLVRDASCISFGAEADAIVAVAVARRAEGTAASDQVLAVFRRQDYTLQPTRAWDALGMRGACSVEYGLRAEGAAGQVLAEPYDRIHARTMTPFAHLLWSSTWQGIAAEAFRVARAFARQAARQSGGRTPPGVAHLTQARVTLDTLRAVVQAALASFARRDAQPGGLDAGAQLAFNLLKAQTSELATATVMSAMRACGLAGYRNDSEFAMGRRLRDILSAPIMIDNDRILADAEAGVLMTPPPVGLTAER